jgi:hypothetical protein
MQLQHDQKRKLIEVLSLNLHGFQKHVYAKSFQELELGDSMTMGYIYKGRGAAILSLRHAVSLDHKMAHSFERSSTDFRLQVFICRFKKSSWKVVMQIPMPALRVLSSVPGSATRRCRLPGETVSEINIGCCGSVRESVTFWGYQTVDTRVIWILTHAPMAGHDETSIIIAYI